MPAAQYARACATSTSSCESDRKRGRPPVPRADGRRLRQPAHVLPATRAIHLRAWTVDRRSAFWRASSLQRPSTRHTRICTERSSTSAAAHGARRSAASAASISVCTSSMRTVASSTRLWSVPRFVRSCRAGPGKGRRFQHPASRAARAFRARDRSRRRRHRLVRSAGRTDPALLRAQRRHADSRTSVIPTT